MGYQARRIMASASRFLYPPHVFILLGNAAANIDYSVSLDIGHMSRSGVGHSF